MNTDSADLEALDRRWRHLNSVFEQNSYRGPLTGPAWKIDIRDSPLCVSAVHAVKHHRPGLGTKSNDANTGGLVLLLAERALLSSGVILKSDDLADANTDPVHPFKAALLNHSLVGPGRVLLDFHGMKNHTDFDLALGFGLRPNSLSLKVAEHLRSNLHAAGLMVDLGGSITGLRATAEGTMTSWAQRLNAGAVQVEVALRHRSFRSAPMERQAFLSAMLEAVEALSTDLTVGPDVGLGAVAD
jgi:hypothetical protein